MNDWLKYIAFGIIALFFVAFVFDAVKAAKIQGGTTWRQILFDVLIIVVIFIVAVVVNYFLNRNWVPGKMLFTIKPF